MTITTAPCFGEEIRRMPYRTKEMLI